MEYEEFSVESKDQALVMLHSNDREQIIQALIGAVKSIDDAEWLQDIYLKFCLDDDFWIAKTAIYGLSDIARIHKRLDQNQVYRVLNSITDESLIGVVQDAREDIEVFLRNGD